jgi:hypothetical protein
LYRCFKHFGATLFSKGEIIVEERVQPQQLLPFVDDRDAVALNFSNRETFIQALGILCEGAAYGRPYELGFRGEEYIIIVNRTDQHFFEGLAFTEEHGATPDEVSLEDLTRKNFFADTPQVFTTTCRYSNGDIHRGNMQACRWRRVCSIACCTPLLQTYVMPALL